MELHDHPSNVIVVQVIFRQALSSYFYRSAGVFVSNSKLDSFLKINRGQGFLGQGPRGDRCPRRGGSSGSLQSGDIRPGVAGHSDAAPGRVERVVGVCATGAGCR